MFSPEGLYGFCLSQEGEEVFFHAQDFHRSTPGEPPPILGEEVEVGSLIMNQGNRAKASLVKRPRPPELLSGLLRSFDSRRGWGFVELEDTRNVFLHMSDRAEDWMPVIGTRISFYLGVKNGKTRACWARPVPSR